MSVVPGGTYLFHPLLPALASLRAGLMATISGTLRCLHFAAPNPPGGRDYSRWEKFMVPPAMFMFFGAEGMPFVSPLTGLGICGCLPHGSGFAFPPQHATTPRVGDPFSLAFSVG
jgi:hypothetical protein